MNLLEKRLLTLEARIIVNDERLVIVVAFGKDTPVIRMIMPIGEALVREPDEGKDAFIDRAKAEARSRHLGVCDRSGIVLFAQSY